MFKKLRLLIPVLFFICFVFILYRGLFHDPRLIPSPLIAEPVVAFTLPDLLQPEGAKVTQDDLKGQITLFNVWASWCSACRDEHAILEALSEREEVKLVGLNYKDNPEHAQKWLGYYGNPYQQIAHDREGLVGIDWGVYGTPETFLIDSKGIIRYKHIGALTWEIYHQQLLPAIEQLQEERRRT